MSLRQARRARKKKKSQSSEEKRHFRHNVPKKGGNKERFERIKLEQLDSFNSLLAYLRIRPDEWDAVIVGDGSGTSWNKEAGFASVLIQKGEFARKLFYGAANCGTNNIAEMMAVFWPLLYLSNAGAGISSTGYRVHVVSDSEYVVNGLSAADPIHDRRLNANRELWLAIHAVKRKGLKLFSHHIRRDTLDLNKLSHDVANLARVSQIKLCKDIDWDINKANPS